LSDVHQERLCDLEPFDCAARRGVLGDEGIEREIERVTRQAGDAPVRQEAERAAVAERLERRGTRLVRRAEH
jgi:hypothetical protein